MLTFNILKIALEELIGVSELDVSAQARLGSTIPTWKISSTRKERLSLVSTNTVQRQEGWPPPPLLPPLPPVLRPSRSSLLLLRVLGSPSPTSLVRPASSSRAPAGKSECPTGSRPMLTWDTWLQRISFRIVHPFVNGIGKRPLPTQITAKS